MTKTKQYLSIGLVTMVAWVGGLSLVQASSPNPMLICIYTANNSNVYSKPGVAISTYSDAYDATVGKPAWGVQYSIAQMPEKGKRVCSNEFSGETNGWSDTHFGYTDQIAIPSRGLILNGVGCSYRNLVKNRSQIGPGIQYALHYSITKTSSNGQPLECVVSNVDVDS